MTPDKPALSRRAFLSAATPRPAVAATAHISSLLALCQPEALSTVHAAIDRIPGTEVVTSDGIGKLVIVAETTDDSGITHVTDRIQDMPGIIAVNLIYHEIDAVDSHVEG